MGLPMCRALVLEARYNFLLDKWLTTMVFGRGMLNTFLSNYRKLHNLVESLEPSHQDGDLTGSEIFMFTDNGMAEGSFYKGNPPSKTLFDLVL